MSFDEIEEGSVGHVGHEEVGRVRRGLMGEEGNEIGMSFGDGGPEGDFLSDPFWSGFGELRRCRGSR